MTEQMSEMIDGELDGFDAASLNVCLNRLCEDPVWRRDWALAHLIGDHLRGHLPLLPGFSLRLARRLAAEPTVVAPRRLASPQTPLRLALSVAASLLGVAVVCWAVLAMNSQHAFDVAMAPASRPTTSHVAPQGVGARVSESQANRQVLRPSLVNAYRQE